MPIVAETDSRQQIAIDHLKLCRSQLTEAKRLRTMYVELARQYGLSNQAIGDALGITEAGVRRILSDS
ncbi:hypothetical protein [Curtobacterium sp. MCSS17_015]|uniref:hypothetical protein n=1 Tax=Curtobacterium sp. MCSS17_015 TaxID=2175666 RepID=UPI0011B4F9E7|nr:hypothetical protein [Curtobacterium sp. MCSS17_015]WIB25843.1 hypothetical protein DEJ18_12405 [Curtobacterium sp. MCSS17_015]